MFAFLRTMVIRSAPKEPTEPPKTADSESKQTLEDTSVSSAARNSESSAGISSSSATVTSELESNRSDGQPVEKPKVGNEAAIDVLGKKSEAETSDSLDDEEDLDHPLQWMVRTCNFYYEEYRECKRWKGRFHQWFVDGAFEDCSPHKDQYDNCQLWKSKGDLEALERIIAYERSKIRIRLRNHLANDVWENRERAPEDWNKPLPADITNEYKTSVLETKKEDLEKDTRREHYSDDQTLYADNSTCAIV